MNRQLLRAPADPNTPTAAVVDENPRQVITAFFLALAVYVAATFGVVAWETASLDGPPVLAAEPTVQVDAAETM